MTADPIIQLLNDAAGARVLCIGDLMLDRFVYGDVKRVSPEAPIPILRNAREQEMLGAVGNVARNVASLGGVAVLLGVVGDDAEGRILANLIGAEQNVEGDVLPERGRRTTLKTRFVAGGQQLLRVDAEASA
ncbi:MAG: PfkB family carbohydrate kinase, partial [Pseudomonadota bacterium]